ncbi:Gfo/Idh/MocA family oxidoreductase [Candidatus Daviesbacteria bacterium]|nr:Gfo/Idh/MocA family oxidoreductase [Candidatus Daviesbacteria bacterium]
MIHSFTVKQEIGVGFIGAGDVSLNHTPGIKACEGANLVGLYDISPERAAARSRKYHCKRYDSAEELVNDPRIDAVEVLTPLEFHLPNVKLALEAGKHVLVEKPVGITITQIEEMKRLSNGRGLICMPGHNEIYAPDMVETQDLIKRGKFGKLSAIYLLYNIRHPEEVAKRYHGVIRETGIHKCYTLLFLAGRPKSVQAMKTIQHYKDYDQEDIFMANFEMENGALAHMEVNFAADDHSADPWSLYAKVIGTKGSARYGHNDRVVNKKASVHSHTYLDYPETIRREDAHFIDCIRGQKQPLSTLDDAVIAIKLTEGIEQSIRESRTVTF